MADTIEEHEGTVSIRGRTITNLRFADDIDGLAGEEEELAKLVECFDKASSAYGLGISAETKLMTNNTTGINTEIKVNGQKLETSLERQEDFSQFQDTTDALPCHIHFLVNYGPLQQSSKEEYKLWK